MLKILATLPLAHQPGTVWRYSMAHDVLGYLISIIADTPFDSFLEGCWGQQERSDGAALWRHISGSTNRRN
jgi:hypothetical protein